MLEALKPLTMAALTGIISAIATHYHFTTEQTQQATVDALGLIGFLGSAAGTAYFHMKAYWSMPPQSAPPKPGK